jgi:hypothetical protein
MAGGRHSRNFCQMLCCIFSTGSLYSAAARKAPEFMFASTARNGTIDRVAIGLSGLCLVHCLASAVFLAVISTAGGLFLTPVIHEVGLVLAIGLGSIALGRGVVEHGFMMPAAIGGLGLGVMSGALTMPHDGTEAIFTIVGVAMLALGHDLNRRAVI